MINFQTEIQLTDQTQYSLIAVDLGYSRSRATCGIMHGGLDKPQVLTFGTAVNAARQYIESDLTKTPILVIEAVLSTFHNQNGNPDMRGDFERGRGWYYGPGAVTFVAAMRFIQALRGGNLKCPHVILAEAFLSFHKGPTDHARDAKIIYEQFWLTAPANVNAETEPILEFISGVPSVRVFIDGRGV